MGIQVEFDPDLALRAFATPGRKPEECIPEKLKQGAYHRFEKLGQRNYWLEGEIPLRETKGGGQLSRPLASVVILEETHRVIDSKIYTQGLYRIIEVFDPEDKRIKFDGLERIK